MMMTATLCLAACTKVDGNPETVAIYVMLEIGKAEQRYHSQWRHYASLSELDGVAESPWRGYDFELTVTATGYVMQARPRIWNRDGRRSFLSGESGGIHQCWENRPATFADPLLK